MSLVNTLDTLVDREFFESIDRYKPREDDFLNAVREMLPDWNFYRNNGVWFGCQPPATTSRPARAQGWKIHLSSSNLHATDLLKTVAPTFRNNSVSFKFSVDRRILSLMNGKQWIRQGAGKFITVYPQHDDEFAALIEELYRLTKGFSGPYILSDKRYKDSKVVFYRYGGIVPQQTVNVDGSKTGMLSSPTGELVPDLRLPYFIVPHWVRDPFSAGPGEELSEKTKSPQVPLKDGRYLVKSVLRYSNSGGVYVAEDGQTQKDVVIKEARPFVESTEDATSLLRKEYRLLTKIKHLNLAPQPIDFFQDWENFFLVEELITGVSLSAFSARNNVALLTQPTIQDTEHFYEQFKIIFLQLADIIHKLHEHRIVFSDFSPGNLILSLETLKLSIVDFEGAYEIGIDNPVQLFTHGFAYVDQMAGKPASFQSDYFSLGAIIHHFLWPVNDIFAIHPRARYTFLQSVTRDIGFPESTRSIVAALLDRAPEKRPNPSQVIEVLSRDDKVLPPRFTTDGPEAESNYREDVKGILSYIHAVATFDRSDRLFPADGAIFRTNPLSIAHGACGVGYVIHKIEGQIPQEIENWILSIPKSKQSYAPGLYVGLTGIAWCMLSMGLSEQSKRVLTNVHNHSLLYSAFDIYQGVAGYGLAMLRFFMETQDQLYLDRAKEAGAHLLASARKDPKGCYWSLDDQIPLGYAHGASGVSLFLLYLYLASGELRFLDTGIKAVEFDISHGESNLDGDGLSWRRFADRGTVLYPYWIYGTAGVGMAVLRYYRLLREEKYRTVLDKIYKDTNRKYSVFPGFFKGLAGKGEFLLDLYEVTRDPTHLAAAYRIATGISLFKIEKETGLAFPGDGLRKISCDYGTGSAGIAHFLFRLIHKDVPGAFNLDELFRRNESKTE